MTCEVCEMTLSGQDELRKHIQLNHERKFYVVTADWNQVVGGGEGGTTSMFAINRLNIYKELIL